MWTSDQTRLLERCRLFCAKLGVDRTDLADAPKVTPTISDIRFASGDIIAFFHRWLKDNAPADVCALFDQYQSLWLAETSYHDNGGQISPRDISRRDVCAAFYAAKAGLFALDPDFEVDDE